MTDYARELQSLELALQSAQEHGYTDTARTIQGQIPGAVATCRRELARVERTPQNYGSAAYAQDVDEAARLSEVLAKYDDPAKPEAGAGIPAAGRRGRRKPAENTADTTPKETT